MEIYCVSCKKILETKIALSEELNKIDKSLYQIVIFEKEKIKDY